MMMTLVCPIVLCIIVSILKHVFYCEGDLWHPLHVVYLENLNHYDFMHLNYRWGNKALHYLPSSYLCTPKVIIIRLLHLGVYTKRLQKFLLLSRSCSYVVLSLLECKIFVIKKMSNKMFWHKSDLVFLPMLPLPYYG